MVIFGLNCNIAVQKEIQKNLKFPEIKPKNFATAFLGLYEKLYKFWAKLHYYRIQFKLEMINMYM